MISSGVRPFRSAARTCIASSSIAVERDERGEGHAAPRPAVEAGPRPDLAPGVARDQVLEVGGELGRRRSIARSTCSSPSTSRRISMPRSWVESVTSPPRRARGRGRRRRPPSRAPLRDRVRARAPPPSSPAASRPSRNEPLRAASPTSSCARARPTRGVSSERRRCSAAGQLVDVRAHPLRVDLEPGQHLARCARRPRRP